MAQQNNSPSLTRYTFGVTTLGHKNKQTTTSVGSEYDSFIQGMNGIKSKKGKLPIFVEYRPDLISNIFYNTPGYWWYIMQFNGITDPFEELKPGIDINIPEL